MLINLCHSRRVQPVGLIVIVTVHDEKAFDMVNCCHVFREMSVCY